MAFGAGRVICISLILRRFAKYYNVQLSVSGRFHSEEFNADIISRHPLPYHTIPTRRQLYPGIFHCLSAVSDSSILVVQINPFCARSSTTAAAQLCNSLLRYLATAASSLAAIVRILGFCTISVPCSFSMGPISVIKFNSRQSVLTLWVVKRPAIISHKRHALQRHSATHCHLYSSL